MDHYKEIAARLEGFGLDAMLISGGHNLLYASGFESGEDGMTLVTRNGAWYFTDSRYIEAANNQVTGAVIEMTETGKEYPVLINKVIAEQGLKKVGFEDQCMSVSEHKKFSEKLNCELVPAQEVIIPLRSIKDEGQVEILTKAQRIAEKALDEAFGYLKPGMTETEVAARLTFDMMRFGARKVSFDPIVASGPNSSMPHAIPGERVIQAGDFVTMDFGCIYGGYCSDMTRTVVVGGQPTDEMRKVYNIVLEAQLAGIAAAKAGVTGKDIDGAARKVITDAGYGQYFGHGFGHGVGIEIHENPNANSLNDKPMPVGAVISAEPGIYIPGKFGVRIEDVVWIREDGCENLTKAPKELICL